MPEAAGPLAASAPQNGDAAMMKATVMFLTPVMFFRIGV